MAKKNKSAYNQSFNHVMKTNWETLCTVFFSESEIRKGHLGLGVFDPYPSDSVSISLLSNVLSVDMFWCSLKNLTSQNIHSKLDNNSSQFLQFYK